MAITCPGPYRNHGPGPLDRSRESCTNFGRCDRDALFLHCGYRWTLGYILAHAPLLPLKLAPLTPANAQLQLT